MLLLNWKDEDTTPNATWKFLVDIKPPIQTIQETIRKYILHLEDKAATYGEGDVPTHIEELEHNEEDLCEES